MNTPHDGLNLVDMCPCDYSIEMFVFIEHSLTQSFSGW